MSTVELTEDETRQATELGLSRGWEHANYVEAYGTRDNPEGISYPAIYEDWTIDLTESGAHRERARRKVLRAVYAAAWGEGSERFRRGEDVDGVKREDD